MLPYCVSIHAPTRGATRAAAQEAARLLQVSIHAPTRGATAHDMLAELHQALFQSTRPRGARLLDEAGIHPSSSVSIHAPTRGATPSLARRAAWRKCFNPRAHAGRDASATSRSVFATWFQSTRPRGARRGASLPAPTRAAVSIHAPTRGATRPGCQRRISRSRFNPRAHAGRDRFAARQLRGRSGFQSTRPRGARRYLVRYPRESDLFQSTRPRGARPSGRNCRLRRSCFNPRAHAGRDWMLPIRMPHGAGFQSTRPRGARHRDLAHEPRYRGFQSTRPRGARLEQGVSTSPPVTPFQSTRPRGARPGVVLSVRMQRQFQSTRPRGARRPSRPLAGLP